MATINITALDSASTSELSAGMSLLGWKSDKTLKAVPSFNLRNAFRLAHYIGPLDVTGTAYLSYLPTSTLTSIRLATAADADGNTSGGYAVCHSGLAALIHPSDSRGAAVNLGDLLLLYWDSNASAAKVKVIPFGEAKKPADAGGVGTYGQMVPNDMEKLDQCVADIDQTCFRCYSGEYNMNYCGWYGYYMHGTLSRPAGSADGEYYVLRVANGGTETDDDGNTWVVLEQTAYSCQDPARVFRRIVKTKDRSAMGADGNTTWGEWTQLPTAADVKSAAEVADAAAENAGILLRDLAQYEESDPLTLSLGTSGKYIDTTGAKKSNSAYAISAQVTLEKGYLYLVKPTTALATGVALVSEYTTENKDVVIEYTYTYDTDGTTPLTATADYDTSLVYTYNYEEDSEGNKTLKNITDKSGNVVDYLPQYRTVAAGSYIPLFKNLSTTTPKSGYYSVLCNETCKAVFSLPVADITTTVIKTSYGFLRSIINQKEDKAVVKKLQEQVAQLEAQQDMFTQSNFADAVYDTLMESDPAADGEYGTDNPADVFDFIMVDHTADVSDNGGAPYYVLERNNTFRYKGGGCAPVVSITDDEMTACTDTTYSRSIYLGDTAVKTFAEGEDYDAEAVLEAIKAAYEAGTAAYTDAITMASNGTSGQHVVMPWETTSQDMSLYLANTKNLWLIDHQEGKSGKVHTAILRRNTMIDGIDPTDYELKPTGLTPSAVFTITNSDSKVVTRCHFTTRVGMKNCNGCAGADKLVTAFYDNGTYPRVSDMQQISLMNWARANNADSTSPTPHAEGGFHALNALICALEVEHKTKYLHNPQLFGSGISANDTCNSEATLLSNGGMRYKDEAASDWTYAKVDTGAINIYNSSATKYNAYSLHNQQGPKERTMESQTAMSWAAELGIAPDVDFTTPYGGTYRYENVDGATAAPSSLMAVRCYKLMSFNIDAYNADKEATTFNVEAMLRFSLYNGAQLAGDIFHYCGGAELVALQTEDAQLVSGVSGIIPLTFYLQPDQSKWLHEKSIYKDDLAKFDFQQSYREMGTAMNGDAIIKDRLALTPLKTENGGSMATYQCAYQWSNNYFNTSLSRRTRLAVRFGGTARNGYCASRALLANYAVSYAYRNNGGFAQVLLGDPLQAE